MKRHSSGGLSAALIVFALLQFGHAQAQEPPRRVRGTIEAVDGGRLTIKTREGAELTVQLKENAPVIAVVPASLADIKPGLYVGITGRPQPDGSQRALEVHIFAEAMRGLGEGHRPWDLEPGSTMTNGAVARASGGRRGANADSEI